MIKLSRDKNLSRRNTFRMKVRSASCLEFSDPSDLVSVDWDSLPRPFLVLGSGSNLLFTSDFPGTVIISRIKGMEVMEEMCTGDDVVLRVGSAETMDEVCRKTAAKGWWGAENLSGIPGTAGAAPVQNVGAYGVEAADIIEKVECFDIETHKFVSFNAEQCAFAYRDSFFKHNKGRYIVLYVFFHLYTDFRPRLDYAHLQEEVERNAGLSSASSDPYNPLYGGLGNGPQMPVTPVLVRETVKIMRLAKLPDPAKVGSAGSFFKNPVVDADKFATVQSLVRSERGDAAVVPSYALENGDVKIPAAFLIEFCGLKGKRLGGAMVWEKQPLVIVNADGKATPEDVLALEREIIDKVNDKFGIILCPEVDHI